MDKTNIEYLLRSEFPQDSSICYLNHAAVSPWPKRVQDALSCFAAENVHSGATYYNNWLQQEAMLREQLRGFINADTVDEISLLKNTSEALSVVAEGLSWRDGDNIVSSDEEFPSNRIPWQAQVKHGVEYRAVSLKGDAPEHALMNACDQRTRILSISAVQYASGFRLNLQQLGDYCRAHGILYCIDGIQSLGAAPIDVQAIQADFLMADAHKWLMGPEGIALFYCRAELQSRLALHQYGWHMVENWQDYSRTDWSPARSARRFECGSLNMLGIYALSASLSLLTEVGMHNVSRMIINKVSYLIDNIKNINKINLLSPTDLSRRLGILNFCLSNGETQKLYKKLLQDKLICAYRGGGIRLSPHFYTTDAVLEDSIELINRHLK